ncbi:hypothetical protein IAQ61_000249 [Plenodomus lingam]|uniref:Predicted protein n=1 Tax=Leptosphaeria maculans (strain JN3 / isolate v23.1.3 / race Av1-4-5-6-7-8) TaxID=985895 RepID=E5R585_LEPMJ|nr:predicted protein [Plenodomus lingam JN3]KAH9881523.1 hypothetical protein IAQ61_000249 [Plenodomus lingam]CBX92055.1 predicted protein [Plenodomus lingam JN3]
MQHVFWALQARYFHVPSNSFLTAQAFTGYLVGDQMIAVHALIQSKILFNQSQSHTWVSLETWDSRPGSALGT